MRNFAPSNLKIDNLSYTYVVWVSVLLIWRRYTVIKTPYTISSHTRTRRTVISQKFKNDHKTHLIYPLSHSAIPRAHSRQFFKLQVHLVEFIICIPSRRIVQIAKADMKIAISTFVRFNFSSLIRRYLLWLHASLYIPSPFAI